MCHKGGQLLLQCYPKKAHGESVSYLCSQNSHGCAIVENGSRYQYQYSMTLGCNTNINNKSSGFATSIPISILVQLIQQYQYWYQNHFLQICNINNNIKSLTLAIPITPQYHLILQYLGININIWFNNSTIKCFLGVNFTHSNA